MATKKTLQRKKPGFTKNGVAKIVSMSVQQLVTELDRTQKKKVAAKINRRLNDLGYVAPVVEVFVDGHGDVREVVAQ
jgi:hypothetical protein